MYLMHNTRKFSNFVYLAFNRMTYRCNQLLFKVSYWHVSIIAVSPTFLVPQVQINVHVQLDDKKTNTSFKHVCIRTLNRSGPKQKDFMRSDLCLYTNRSASNHIFSEASLRVRIWLLMHKTPSSMQYIAEGCTNKCGMEQKYQNLKSKKKLNLS